jgi:hydrogenase maturation protein HypF
LATARTPRHFATPAADAETAALLRVRGLVQGVGFRPAMWHLAKRHGLRGWVINDGEGVQIHIGGPASSVEAFVFQLRGASPPLARIDRIEREAVRPLPRRTGFEIRQSDLSPAGTSVAPDAATCAACVEEIFDPRARRFRYPFTNCTNCGPRLSIIRQIPYDRARTSMAAFVMCADCRTEYEDPADRRFHAEPIACPACGPQLRLRVSQEGVAPPGSLAATDAIEAASILLLRGRILAIQGLGGYQLACDATQPEAVMRLRSLKNRERKPFALMARDLGVIREYAQLNAAQAALLAGPAAPIVLLRMHRGPPLRLAAGVAPGLASLGFMLPNSPLHHLLLARMTQPIVLTSGNRSDEPQAIEAADARHRLQAIAEYFLEHDRPIERRVDDSVVHWLAGRPRVLRRARGYAPDPLPLPSGFETTPRVFAYGGESKNTFCMLRNGAAILSPHLGNLQYSLARADQSAALADLRRFFNFFPEAVGCDLHPDYAATRAAHTEAGASGLPLFATQHHHAHIAACMAENGIARTAPAVLGVALDGTGYGADGTLWGGEFLLAQYEDFRRLGRFKPVALLGGDAAIREPWRNTYAQLIAHLGWDHFATNYADLELYRFLASKPRTALDRMRINGVNSPLSSSCGRLFDAAAAAIGFARESASYEGQGAVDMQAAVDRDCRDDRADLCAYQFTIRGSGELEELESGGMWSALLDDLACGTAAAVMAARFHRGLARGIVRMVQKLVAHRVDGGQTQPAIALSGGVFQNEILFEHVVSGLQANGFRVLTHSQVPCNDGGLALGQALIAAARSMSGRPAESALCA